MASDRTIIHAVIGAVVGILLSFIPFSTVIGGAVAGFLEGPDDRAGTIAGALAGVIAFVPVAAFAVLLLGFLGFGMGVAAAPFEGFAVAAFAILVFALIVLLYTVGLSLLGGYLGAYLAREYPRKHRETRRSLGTAADDAREASPSRDDSRRRSSDRGRNWDRDRNRDRNRPPADIDSKSRESARPRRDESRTPERERDE